MENNIIEKYFDVPLKFSSYYKYEFTFSGTAKDGATIFAIYGGDHNNIYRYTVGADEIKYVEKQYMDIWNSVSVIKNGIEIFAWDDF